jgi:hypothetical protein
MKIRELAYSAQQHLESRCGTPFKRSHVYEILAASFGYKSFAALTTSAVFAGSTSHDNPSARHGAAVKTRCVELGYLPETSDHVPSELSAFVAQHGIGVVRLSDLIHHLRRELSLRSDTFELDPDEEPDFEGNYDGEHEEEHIDPDTGFAEAGLLISPLLIDGLKTAAQKDSATAHYALALIFAAGDDEYSGGRGSSYWYTQGQEGRVLSGVEQEWADAYAKKVADAGAYDYHLREAARLGNRRALLDRADRFSDPSFFETRDNACSADPARVAEIAGRLGRKADARYWLTIAGEAGDTDAMRQLIEGYDEDDLERCWTWVYLAQLVGTDLTQDAYFAVHEDGSDYNDDVGGSAFPIGRDGVRLTALDAARDAAARRAAEQIKKRMKAQK